MNSEQFQRAADIFLQARSLAGEAREAFLQQSCKDDSALRAEVERLLSAGELDTPFPTLSKDLESLREHLRVEPAEPGERIGRYKIIEKLGEGGFGNVYVAEQEQPVRRRVALKVIKLGMDTKQVVARFEAERQALAMMDHPNIAKVFDAGASDSGRPFFVMELVSGVPITRYCDEHRLTARERLELFIPVCQAVQHAHQKGIIHRDLKPSNVLVSLQDGKAIAKVIDFGIAKATQARLTEKTVFTESNQLIGTPEYMSPEQAELSVNDVDTRSDIYSLGVLLYELLAGTTPFDPRELRSKAFAEMQRVIREVDPPKPSTRLSDLNTLPSVAALRGTEPGKLRALVRGELDWIVMKCLEKDRARRYDTANGLAEDVRRYLANEPLNAGPPSRTYRLGKFLRRHQAGVIAAAAMLLLLLSGTTFYIRQMRAEQAKTRAANESLKAVNDFLTDDLLGAANPRVTLGKEFTVKQAVDKASEKVADGFAGRPLVEAEVRNTLATTYYSLGHPELGLPHARVALDLRRKQLGNDHIDTLTSINHLATLARAVGQLDEAESLWREAVDRARRKSGDADELTLLYEMNLAYVVEDRGKTEESIQLLRTALAGFRQLLGDDHSRTLAAMSRLAGLLERQRKYDEAETLFTQALERRRRTLGEDHPDTIFTMNDLALMRQQQGQLDDAEQLMRQVVEKCRRVLGPEHPHTLVCTSNLAGLITTRGRPAEAEVLLRELVQTNTKARGPDHPNTLAMCSQLSAAIEWQGKYSEAEPMIRDLLARMRKVHGDEHQRTLLTASRLGDVLVKLNRPAEAEPLYAEVYQTKKHVKSTPLEQSQAAGKYGILLVKLDRFDDAEPLLREAHDVLHPIVPPRTELRDVLQAMIETADHKGQTEHAASLRRELNALPTTAPTTAPR